MGTVTRLEGTVASLEKGLRQMDQRLARSLRAGVDRNRSEIPRPRHRSANGYHVDNSNHNIINRGYVSDRWGSSDEEDVPQRVERFGN